jgi:hypothetical protein
LTAGGLFFHGIDVVPQHNLGEHTIFPAPHINKSFGIVLFLVQLLAVVAAANFLVVVVDLVHNGWFLGDTRVFASVALLLYRATLL